MARRREEITENAENAEAVEGSETMMAENQEENLSVAETKDATQDEIAATSEAGITEASPEEQPDSELESLNVLADRHRVPTWQQAALLRFMDWNEDRMVSEDEYLDGLDALKNRRIGGGRK